MLSRNKHNSNITDVTDSQISIQKQMAGKQTHRDPPDLTLIKVQPDATLCRYLFSAKSLYMFRVSQHPSSGVLKTVTATSGTGHNTGTATSLQRGQIGTAVPIWPRWREVAAVVVVLCVLLSYVYLLYYVGIAVFLILL